MKSFFRFSFRKHNTSLCSFCNLEDEQSLIFLFTVLKLNDYGVPYLSNLTLIWMGSSGVRLVVGGGKVTPCLKPLRIIQKNLKFGTEVQKHM